MKLNKALFLGCWCENRDMATSEQGGSAVASWSEECFPADVSIRELFTFLFIENSYLIILKLFFFSLICCSSIFLGGFFCAWLSSLYLIKELMRKYHAFIPGKYPRFLIMILFYVCITLFSLNIHLKKTVEQQ